MQIKVCGLNNRENIFALSTLDIDLIGFIFYKPSPRYFNSALSFEETRQIPKRIKKTGVFVNESTYTILNKVAEFDLDLVQLHGSESKKECKELLPFVKVIKAISVEDKASLEKIDDYKDVCDYFLFDTATKGFGGSGKVFDHSLLNKIKIPKPFFISGGISLENVNKLKSLSAANFIGIDVNSKFEINPGLKDLDKLKQLLKIK